MDADLVDRIDLFTYPVVLGKGKRVFRSGILPAALRLVGSPQGFPRGSVLTVYERTGTPEYRDINA